MNNVSIFCIEGIDNCGKTTVIRNLHKRLSELGLYNILVYKSFDSDDKNSITSNVRELILDKEVTADNANIYAYLYSACRLEMIQNIKTDIKEIGKDPLKRSKPIIVLLDRYVLSTLVYQRMQGADAFLIESCVSDAVNRLKPDITFVLNTDVDICKRRSKPEDNLETYFSTKYPTLKDNYNSFRSFYSRYTNTIEYVDNNGLLQSTVNTIMYIINPYLKTYE